MKCLQMTTGKPKRYSAKVAAKKCGHCTVSKCVVDQTALCRAKGRLHFDGLLESLQAACAGHSGSIVLTLGKVEIPVTLEATADDLRADWNGKVPPAKQVRDNRTRFYVQ